MPNYGYHLARAKGDAVRKLYRSSLKLITNRPVEINKSVSADVFSYSGKAALPEQVASIRSFLRYAGRPKTFTVVSDGTLSAEDIHLLESVDPVVRVRKTSEFRPENVPPATFAYLTEHPTGKQQALIMSLPTDGPAIYTDSDVLFFEGAGDLEQVLRENSAPARYLPDCKLSADDRLFRSLPEQTAPVNTGFLILFRNLDWSLALSRLIELDGPPTFFTNQTLTHLAMHLNHAVPLDPEKYVLQLDDQFVYPDRYAGKRIALRHYVNPVRHKFWARFPR